MEKACIKCDVVKPETTEFFRFRTDTKKLNNTCLVCQSERNKQVYQSNREHFKKRAKEYYQTTEKFSKKRKEQKAKWFQENKEKNTIRQREYRRKRKQADPFYKMRVRITKNISASFKRMNWGKNTQTANMLGCDWDTFKIHIENQFTEGMNWDNQGKWHFDHITPISSAKNEEELIKLNHYTNFQPLWAEDNWLKSNKLLP